MAQILKELSLLQNAHTANMIHSKDFKRKIPNFTGSVEIDECFKFSSLYPSILLYISKYISISWEV